MTQYLLNGLMLGGIYGLMAVAYSLVYGVLGLVNFAFGEIFMFGAFIALFAMQGEIPFVDTQIGFIDVGFPLALLVGIVAAGLLGVLVERVAYKPLRSAPILTMLIATIAASLVLRSLAQIIFGDNQHPFPDPVAGDPVEIFGTMVSRIDLLIMAVGAAVMVAISLVIGKTSLGRGIRATAQDPDTARLMGISVDRVIVSTFLIGSMLAGLAGVLYAAKYQFVDPIMGFLPSLKALVAAVVGGIGNVPGAFIGGIMIGLIEALAGGYIPGGSAWRDAIVFVVLGVMLWVRPQGLLGVRVVERA
ncbi:MAG: branched-chain amino acid ABC transporter permease [Solirubrobacterales bacterium]|nr:branched-chain amino acid ABC transporter permease [Solirubrobacterales bacterium]